MLGQIGEMYKGEYYCGTDEYWIVDGRTWRLLAELKRVGVVMQ